MIAPTLYTLALWKKFKKLAKKEATTDSIVDEIKDESDLYCFYSSKALLLLSPTAREEILSSLLKKFPRPEHQWRVNYLKMAFTKQAAYYTSAINAIGKVKAEDIIYFFECKLQFMKENNVMFDGKKFSPEVVDSQFGHLISTFSEVIKFISAQNINFLGKPSRCHAKNCEQIVFAISYFLIIKEQIKEVLSFSYEVIPSSLISPEYFGEHHEKVEFLLRRKISNWASLEIYRDLNYSYLTKTEENTSEMIDVMRKAKVLLSSENNNFLHFDFAKAAQFSIEMRFHRVSKLISEIYESVERNFIFNEKLYKIYHLLEFAKNIYELADKLESKGGPSGSKNKIHQYGEKQFSRILGIDSHLKHLIELFTYDFDDKATSKPTFLPILRKNNVYYISTSHILSQCYEKVIDKILSRNDIFVNLKEREKGLSFEATLQSDIKSTGLEIGKIARDEKKGIPEIDGVFSLSDKEIIVYEAKCTVKPEEREDAYSFVENHLAKACNQLLLRADFLRKKTKEAEERLKFPIAQKNITCLLITNHSYFTGLNIAAQGECSIHIIDRNLLLQILSKKTIPTWSFNIELGTYSRVEEKLHSTDDIIAAIRNPVQFLKSKGGTTVQISEYGAAYEISSTPELNFDLR